MKMSTENSKDSQPLSVREELENKGIFFINSIIEEEEMESILLSLLDIYFNKNFTGPIYIFINSAGGTCDVGFSLIDMIQTIDNEVITIATGAIYSMAVSIFIAGNRRIISPNCIAMIHELSGETKGNYTEFKAVERGYELEWNRYIDHYIKYSKYKTEEEVRKYIIKQYDNWLSPQEMKKHGMCDEISLNFRVNTKDNVKI